MRVIDLAEGRPVDLLVAQRLHGGVQLFLGDGVEVISRETADHQRDGGQHRADRLGALIQILVRQQQDQQREERRHRHDHAQIVPQPELRRVGLARGVDVVGLLPELRADDQAGQIQHDEHDQLPDDGHKRQMDLAEEHQHRQYLEDDGGHPEADRADAQRLRVADLLGGLQVRGGLLRLLRLRRLRAGLYLLAGIGGNDLMFLFLCHNNLLLYKVVVVTQVYFTTEPTGTQQFLLTIA